MKYIVCILLILTCSCVAPDAGTYRTEKAYVGPTNGRYRIDTVFYVLKKGKYIYQQQAPKVDNDDDSNPAIEQYQRDLIFGD